MRENAALNLSRNPFEQSHSVENLMLEYEHEVRMLGNAFIYETQPAEQIYNKTSVFKSKFLKLEKENHELDALMALMKGVEAHEKASFFFGGAWQAALSRLPKGEKSSRQEAERALDASFFKKQMLEAEQRALNEFERFLKYGFTIQVENDIFVEPIDVEVLANDLRVRRAERTQDDAQRKAELDKLDEELVKIIEKVPNDQSGNRFELEELYLLRRLIHSADTGHLVSVYHGGLREDLNPERGSVDLEVTALGERFQFQIKSFKSGASAEAREVQRDALARAWQKLADSNTILTVLDNGAVDQAYKSSLRQGKSTTLTDKYVALKPLADALTESKGLGYLSLFGITPQELEKEKQNFEGKIEERRKFEEEVERKRQEQARREAEAEERRRAEQEAQDRKLVEERLKQEAIQEQQRIEALKSQIKRQEALDAERQKQEKVRITLEQASRREAEKREAEKRLEEEKRKKEEKKKSRENIKKDWPPKEMTNLANAAALKKLGLLPQEWSNDVTEFLKAKKQFIELFVSPGKTGLNEKGKPNKLFSQVFPNKQSFDTPGEEELGRMRLIIKN